MFKKLIQRIYTSILCLFLTIPINGIQQKKIIGLIPVRNEAAIIAQCLKALSAYTDAIIVLDDASDDETVTIIESLMQECRIEKIIKKTEWHRNESQDRTSLLEAGRHAGGTHFIVIDADEIFSSNCMNNNWLRNKILKLKQGDSLYINFVNLWRSTKYYRTNYIWKPYHIGCAFCDDQEANFSSEFLHTPRIPAHLSGKKQYISSLEYVLIHFQFVNWDNLLVKQAWYRCLEHIRNPNKSIAEINALYAPSKNETQLERAATPKEWFAHYSFFDPTIYTISDHWRKKQVQQWFAYYGKEYFAELDIWNIDWDDIT